MLRSHENSVAAWAFLIGIILAIAIGLSTPYISALKLYSSPIYIILIILGIVVGSMITAGKDSQTFLMIGAILVIISKFGMESVRESLIGIGLVDVVSSTFSALLVLFIPATIIVAIKAVFALAKL
jgi:hypothetical protein